MKPNRMQYGLSSILFIALALVLLGGGIALVQRDSLTVDELPTLAPTLEVAVAQAVNMETSTVTPIETDSPPTETATASVTASSTLTNTPTVGATSTSRPTLAPMQTMPTQAEVSVPTTEPIVVAPPSEPVPDVVIVRVDPSQLEQLQADVASHGGTVELVDEALGAVTIQLPNADALEEVTQAEYVEASEPDYFVSVQQSEVDPLTDQQWSLNAMNIPTTVSADARAIKVAVIDSGVCDTHPELSQKIIGGYDYVQSDTTPQDEMGHGCAVAGIIASAVNGVGMVGVAPNAQLLIYRVLNANGSGRYSHVASAIVRAVDDGAQIINLSLGGANASQLLQDAVTYALERNVLVVAAAGNNGSASVLYPAIYEGVISVGASGRDLNPATFSNYGKIDLWAPGVEVLSLTLQGEYASFNGTSFAAPNVSGLLARNMGEGTPVTVRGGGFAQYNDETVVIAPSPTVTQEIPQINVNFNYTQSVPSQYHQPILDLLHANLDQITSDELLVTSYRNVDTWSEVIILPLDVLQSNWGTFSEERLIHIILYESSGGVYHAVLKDSSEFDEIVPMIPLNFMDVRPDVVAQNTGFKFPWVSGQQWVFTQSWHQGNNLDFAPSGGMSYQVRSSNSGLLTSVCPDPYQSMVQVAGSDGATTYLHLATSSINSSMFGQNVTQGFLLGELYNGSAQEGGICNGNYKYNTRCGCGTGAHLHFGLPRQDIVIDGHNASELIVGGQYTSSNSVGNPSILLERQALIAFYNSTNGIGWTHKTGWLTETDHCTWYGVVCDLDGNVITLYLGFNQLSGTIPAELGNLSNLVNLDLTDNQLSGTIPPELGNLANLHYLDLTHNQLSGTIPPELGNLTGLQWLSLYSNQLSGSIPSSLGNLTNLQHLGLSYNQLISGSIPSSLGNLTGLHQLHLSSNQLGGSIPAELGNLANLHYLDLSYNQLSGSIPAELGNLANLQNLLLNYNQLSGSIPAELGNFSNLGIVGLSYNQLSGSIPAELGNLAYLDLSYNQLSGSIPAELGNNRSPWWSALILHNNQLSGVVPNLSNISSLHMLTLCNNNSNQGILPSGNPTNDAFIALFDPTFSVTRGCGAGKQLSASIASFDVDEVDVFNRNQTRNLEKNNPDESNQNSRLIFDGTQLKLSVKISNLTQRPTPIQLEFIDTNTNETLSVTGCPPPHTLQADKTFVCYWDSTGYAWRNGSPRLNLNIMVRIKGTDGTLLGSRQFGEILIAPTPIVLIQGLGNTHTAWDSIAEKIRNDGNDGVNFHPNQWVFAAGDGQDNIDGSTITIDLGKPPTNLAFYGVTGVSINTNAERLNRYIYNIRKIYNIRQIDLVGHSTGAVVSRLYIQNYMSDNHDNNPTVRAFVSTGGANKGSWMADSFCSTGRCRGRGTIYYLRTGHMRDNFNPSIINNRGVVFMAIAAEDDDVVGYDSASAVGVPQFWRAKRFTVSRSDCDSWDLGHCHGDGGSTSAGTFNAFVRTFLQFPNWEIEASTVFMPQNATIEIERQTIDTIGLLIAPNETVTHTFNLPSELDDLQFSLILPTNVDFALLSPDTTPVLSVSATQTVDLETVVPIREVFEFPASGTWTINLTNHHSQSVEVFGMVEVSGSLITLKPTAQVQSDQSVILTAQLLNSTTPLLNTSVTALVSDPELELGVVNLLDDGTEGDVTPNDGIYTRRIDSLSVGDHIAFFSAVTSDFEVTDTVDFQISLTDVGVDFVAQTIVPGVDFTVPIRVTNLGEIVSAEDVSLSFALPPSVSLVEAKSNRGLSCTTLNEVVTCTIGTLAPSLTETFDIILRADASETGTSFTLQATVTALTHDPTPSNNIMSNGFTAVASMVNDDWSGAIPLVLSQVVEVDTQQATPGSVDPISCRLGEGKSVWYTFTPNSSSPIQIKTMGSNFPTIISVFTGSTPENFQLIQCGYSDGVSGQASTTLPVGIESGIAYFIMVQGESSEGGNLRLEVSESTSPSNDSREVATTITGLPFIDLTSNLSSTLDASDPIPSCVISSGNLTGGVWYRYSPSSNQPIRIDTSGSNFDTVLSIYSDSLTEIACNDDHESLIASVTMLVETDQTYYIHVQGNNGGLGALSLSVESLSEEQDDERDIVLVALYNQTDGQNWTNNSGWLSDNNHCTWYGIVCNGTGKVIEINLARNQLNGEIPAELEALNELTRLSLEGNQLHGSIPLEIGNLSKLQFMLLENNQLSGILPYLLGTSLSELSLCQVGNNEVYPSDNPENNTFVGNLDSFFSIENGCSDPTTPTPSSTMTPSPSPTFTPSPIYTPTIIPSPTVTFTPSPTFTPTITPTPTATFTPSPTPIPSPNPTSPINGAGITTFTPALAWSAVAGATGYEVRYGLSNPPTQVISNLTSTSYTFSQALTTGTFYWQVRAKDRTNNWSAWSSVASFNVNSVAGSAPRPLAQSAGTITLTWNPQSWAQSYQVQVSTDTSFTALVYQSTPLPGGRDNETITLETGTYYWRVRGLVSGTTWGAWSATEMLVVR